MRYDNCVVKYWTGGRIHVKSEDAKYRRYRAEVAKRAIACANGERHVPTGYFLCGDSRDRRKLYTLARTSILKRPKQVRSCREW